MLCVNSIMYSREFGFEGFWVIPFLAHFHVSDLNVAYFGRRIGALV